MLLWDTGCTRHRFTGFVDLVGFDTMVDQNVFVFSCFRVSPSP
jgi:hypothetical protein